MKRIEDLTPEDKLLKITREYADEIHCGYSIARGGITTSSREKSISVRFDYPNAYNSSTEISFIKDVKTDEIKRIIDDLSFHDKIPALLKPFYELIKEVFPKKCILV